MKVGSTLKQVLKLYIMMVSASNSQTHHAAGNLAGCVNVRDVSFVRKKKAKRMTKCDTSESNRKSSARCRRVRHHSGPSVCECESGTVLMAQEPVQSATAKEIRLQAKMMGKTCLFVFKF